MSTLPPGLTPKAALKSGYITKAGTLEELAGRIGVDPVGLRATVDRFNAMAERGLDEDFGRGSNAYDNWYGDPSNRPNPNLGPIARAVLRARGLARRPRHQGRVVDGRACPRAGPAGCRDPGAVRRGQHERVGDGSHVRRPRRHARPGDDVRVRRRRRPCRRGAGRRDRLALAARVAIAPASPGCRRPRGRAPRVTFAQMPGGAAASHPVSTDTHEGASTR